MKKILLLTTQDRPREYTHSIKTNTEEDLDAQVDICNLEDIRVESIEAKVSVVFNGVELSDYDFVYIKHWHSFEEAALVVATFCDKNNIPLIPSETNRIVPKTKFAETFFMSMHNLPVPNSIFYKDNESYISEFVSITEKIGLPFVCKAIDGKKGANNYLINSKEELRNALEQASDHNYILQGFVDNNGDYRIINFGNDLKIAIYRTRGEGTHLNNTSQGGDGELVDIELLPEIVRDDSIRAIKLLGRELSGIDVVIDTSGNHYFFEINYSPQITTGTYLDVKRQVLSKYLESALH